MAGFGDLNEAYQTLRRPTKTASKGYQSRRRRGHEKLLLRLKHQSRSGGLGEGELPPLQPPPLLIWSDQKWLGLMGLRSDQEQEGRVERAFGLENRHGKQRRSEEEEASERFGSGGRRRRR
ncbi:uncharacterized protein G2W53_026541 [Senna tora]|uniref:Uncharacterized protein n=1 Tax=Senna tora TaxID=362788 RepID=A0A834TH68_9FABA|nr:uncharacterized protein G2W53_026541 [Senna tora]